MTEQSDVRNILQGTFSEFSKDNCMSMAAALAYYTIFSLPPLLVIIITAAGLVVDPQQIEQEIQRQASGLIGEEAARQVSTMVQNASTLGSQGMFGLILGIGGLLFGATSAFAQLQQALNRAWEVGPDPESGLWNFVSKRLLSLGMVLGIAFLLLVSLVLSAALSALASNVADAIPVSGQRLLWLVNAAISLLVVTLLFAAIFKVMPDVQIVWRDVWVGAFATALLFEIGKFLIGLYLGQSNPGEAFGAAGSLALILVWVYYSALILLLGAEFTQVWARQQGHGIKPEKGAVRIVNEKRVVSPDEADASTGRPDQLRHRPGQQPHRPR